MTKLKYNLKSDTLFKMLFTKNQDLLKWLVSALLGIKYEDITELNVINPEISPEELGKKFCRLDINMTVNSKHNIKKKSRSHHTSINSHSLLYYSKAI